MDCLELTEASTHSIPIRPSTRSSDQIFKAYLAPSAEGCQSFEGARGQQGHTTLDTARSSSFGPAAPVGTPTVRLNDREPSLRPYKTETPQEGRRQVTKGERGEDSYSKANRPQDAQEPEDPPTTLQIATPFCSTRSVRMSREASFKVVSVSHGHQTCVARVMRPVGGRRNWNEDLSSYRGILISWL